VCPGSPFISFYNEEKRVLERRQRQIMKKIAKIANRTDRVEVEDFFGGIIYRMG